jgi:S1-C subfamily serine protease
MLAPSTKAPGIGRLVVPLAFLICVGCVSPRRVGAQSYQQHIAECAANVDAQTSALHQSQWPALVSLARWQLTACKDLLRGDDEASTLSMVGIGLIGQRDFEGAIPVLTRCVTIKPDAAYCFEGLGEALVGLGRLGDARKAFEQAVSIGGYDSINASAISLAQRWLTTLPPDSQPAPVPNRSDGNEPASSGGKKFGTGFFVSAEGHILTNNHVVEGCKSLATRDGLALSVVSQNQGADLALLKGDIRPRAFAVFGKPPRIGEPVMAFGFPLPGLLSSEGNSTTGIVSALSGPNDDLNIIQITAPVQPGNSGGPLVDEHGRVVGVVVAKLDAAEVEKVTGDIPQNVNFAVRGNLVTTFLDSTNVPHRTGSFAAAADWPSVAKSERKMSVAIVCTE